MSNSLEFTPIPAFELSKARYRPEEAKRCYESLNDQERETVKFLTDCLKLRLESRLSNSVLEESLPATLVLNNDILSNRIYSITDSVKNYFIALGYSVQLLPSNHYSGIYSPILIIKWC